MARKKRLNQGTEPDAQKAFSLIAGGQLDQAKSVFKAQLKSQETLDPGSLLGLASAHYFSGDTESTTNALRLLLAQISEESAELRHLGMFYAMSRRHKLAGIALRRARSMALNYPELLTDIAYGFLMMKDYREAADTAEMAIKVDSTIKMPYRILGAALGGMQDYPAAIASFKKLIDLDPQDYTAYIFIGKSLASMGEWEKSLTVFQQAWFLNKDHPAANVGRAVALFELNRIDEAAKAANLALENISESPEDAYNLGMLYLEGLNDPDSAITALIIALLDDPGNRERLITLAKAAIRSDAPNAIQQVTDFLDAADPNLGIEFAWTVHRLGSWDAHISAHKADFLPRVNTFKGIARSFSDNPVYQLRIDLEDARPPIWRRVLVPGYYTLADLHHIIQAVMGWEGYHQHEFDVNHVSVGPIMDSGRAWSTRYLVDERDVTLTEAVTASSGKFRYLYDSGDYWIHKIVVEKTLTYDENIRYPKCTGGRRAAPPENSGGIRGYYALLEAFKDPVSEMHEESVRLLGKDFRPDVFDIDAINRRLETIRRQPVE